MKNPVQLICASNANYFMALAVMLVSMVEHFDPERELVIHLISNDGTTQERDNVLQSIRMVRPNMDHIEMRWYSIDAASLDNIPLPPAGHFSRDTYARLFAPHLLPESCARAIYLDCDMVVLVDISKLYDSTADDPAVLHAAQDLSCPLVSSRHGVFDYAERGIPADTRYFNGGVLVINLKKWRERNLTPQIIEYLTGYGHRIEWVDQGAMNAFLSHDWTPLDLRWNQSHMVGHPETWSASGYSKQEWLRVKNNPFIVHYTGSQKPWLINSHYLPRRLYFFRYLRNTVYRNTVAGYPYLEHFLGARTYYRLWRAKIKMFPDGLKAFFRWGSQSGCVAAV